MFFLSVFVIVLIVPHVVLVVTIVVPLVVFAVLIVLPHVVFAVCHSGSATDACRAATAACSQ